MIDKVKKIKVKVKKPLDIELTKLYSDKKNIVQANVKKLDSKDNIIKDDIQGINIDKNSYSAKPKVFVRKIVKSGGENGTTRILGDDKKTVIYEGRNSDKKTEDAVKQSERKSTITNEQREKNSDFFNANYSEKPITKEKDKELLINMKKAVRK